MRPLCVVLSILTLLTGCDDATPDLAEGDTTADATNPYAAGAWNDALDGPDASDATDSLQEPPPAVACESLPLAWEGLHLERYSDTGSPFSLTLIQQALPESLDDSNPCTWQMPDATAALIGHFGPNSASGQVSGLRDDDSVCFIVGESYGMSIYTASIDPTSCDLDGTWSGHAGSFDWQASPAP